MRASLLLALVVGGVLGFFIGRATVVPGSSPFGAVRVPPPGAPPTTQAPSRPPPESGRPRQVMIDGAPVRGSATAQVTLVEYSDYQCPYCSRAHATVSGLEKE